MAGVNNHESHPVVCLDPVTGKVLWRKSQSEELWFLPAAMQHAGAVFVYGEQQTAEWSVTDGALRWTTPGGGDSERLSTVVGDHTAAPSGDLLVLDRRGEQVAARQPLKVKGLRSLVACTTADGVRVLLQTDRQLEAYDLAVRKTISGRASGNGDH